MKKYDKKHVGKICEIEIGWTELRVFRDEKCLVSLKNMRLTFFLCQFFVADVAISTKNYGIYEG